MTIAGDVAPINSNDKIRLPGLTVRGIESLPVPIKQSVPRIGKKLVGTNLVMKFTVDKKGRTGSVRSARPLAGIYETHVRDFAVLMTITLNNWKFKPALNTEGNPVTAKMILPIKVVQRDGFPVALGALRLDTGES